MPGAGFYAIHAVKRGAECARFLRPAYYQLTDFIEEATPGRFLLRCGDSTHLIAQR
jgi:hypothetical protein